MPKPKYAPRGGLFDRPVQLLVVTAALLGIGWIGFVGSLHAHEMEVGAVIVALSTVFCSLVYRSETLSFDLRLRDVAQCWRIPWYVLSDCSQISWLLLKDLAGKRAESLYRVSGFRTGTRDPIAVERSALAIVFTTATPSFIVIGIDPHQNHMLFHQIQRSEMPKMTKALGAQA